MLSASHALYELLIADVVQASQVLENTLTFDHLFSTYLHASERGRSAAVGDPTEGFDRLRREVANLREAATQLLGEVGSIDLKQMVRRRAALGREFERLTRTAGVVLDHLYVADASSTLDMTRTWRRMEVTDQHAVTIANSIGELVTGACASLLVGRQPPKVIIGFRRYTDGRNLSRLADDHNYIVVPFWMLHSPRIGFGVVAHECAHLSAEALILEERTCKSFFADCMSHVRDNIIPIYHHVDTEEPAPGRPASPALARRSKALAENIFNEVLSDVLAATILGPAYVVNLAIYLIGSRELRDEVSACPGVPHSLRLRTLLWLFKQDIIPWPGEWPTSLLDGVQSNTDEYRHLNQADPQRSIWQSCQENITLLLQSAFKDFIERRLLDGANRGLRREFESARSQPCVRSYVGVWNEVNRTSTERGVAGKSTISLVSQLQHLPEMRRFLPPVRSSPPGGSLETDGDAWSLDSCWFRSRATSKPLDWTQLGTWMQAFAPPTLPVDGLGGLYGLVLGASDCLILRPRLRLREPVRLVPEVLGDLVVYVERRALIEITKINRPNGTTWKPEPWTGVRCVTEVRLRDEQSEVEFLDAALTAWASHGVRLLRCFRALGWPHLVCVLRPDNLTGWFDARRTVLGTSKIAPERAVTSILCAHTLAPASESTLTNSWEGCAPSPFEVTSLLRVRRMKDIEDLDQPIDASGPTRAAWIDDADAAPHPTISQVYGLYDGTAVWSLTGPEQLSHVVRWLYAATARDRLTRSVSFVGTGPIP